MGKSIYDCECGGYATYVRAAFIHFRKCLKCGKLSQPATRKRDANDNWKQKKFIDGYQNKNNK